MSNELDFFFSKRMLKETEDRRREEEKKPNTLYELLAVKMSQAER